MIKTACLTNFRQEEAAYLFILSQVHTKHLSFFKKYFYYENVRQNKNSLERDIFLFIQPIINNIKVIIFNNGIML